MASVINGTNIVLYYYNPDTGLSTAFGSSTSCSFDSTTDQLEITSGDSGGFKEYKNAQVSWSVKCDGMICLNDKYNYLVLLQKQMSKEQITVKFTINNDNGIEGDLGYSIFTGIANLTSISLSGPVESNSTYSVSLQGTGAYSITGTVPTETGIVIGGSTVQMYDYTASGSEGYTITFSGAIGLTCISVTRGGVEARKINPTGGVGSEDILFASSTGVVTFARPLESDEFIRAIFK